MIFTIENGAISVAVFAGERHTGGRPDPIAHDVLILAIDSESCRFEQNRSRRRQLSK